MGQVLARVLENLSWGKRDLSIVMLGLDAAGKTTILYRIKLGEKITVIPTIGFNVETIHYRKVKFTVWDVGSQDKIRCLWHHYFHNTQGLIFVVDSKDNERIMEARDELHNVANADELREVTVLVFANKQDLANTMSIEEMTDKLSLARLPQRDWHIQPCSAVTGEGLYEGLHWLSTSLRNA